MAVASIYTVKSLKICTLENTDLEIHIEHALQITFGNASFQNRQNMSKKPDLEMNSSLNVSKTGGGAVFVKGD